LSGKHYDIVRQQQWTVAWASDSSRTPEDRSRPRRGTHRTWPQSQVAALHHLFVLAVLARASPALAVAEVAITRNLGGWSSDTTTLG